MEVRIPICKGFPRAVISPPNREIAVDPFSFDSAGLQPRSESRDRSSVANGRWRETELGFTLTEILVALTLFGLAAGCSIWSLNTINNQSVAARLFTNATFIAQNQIELAQTDGPFVPQKQQVPLGLVIDLQRKPGVTVYTDPVNDNIIVTGTITTEVTDPGYVLNSTNLNMRQVKVTMDYQYRGKSYSVVMDTMRTSDL